MKIFFQKPGKSGQIYSSAKLNIAGYDVDGLDMVQNILSLYSEASAEDELAGNWYVDAHNEAKNMSEYLGVTLEMAAAVIAVISPKQEWETNISQAWRGISAWRFGLELPQLSPTDSLNSEKAYKMLETGVILEEYFGPKTWNFFNTINDPTWPIATVDSHAASICTGLDLMPGTWAIGDAARRKMEDAYAQAAALVGLTPSQIQAITWVCAKRRKIQFKNVMRQAGNGGVAKWLVALWNEHMGGSTDTAPLQDFLPLFNQKMSEITL